MPIQNIDVAKIFTTMADLLEIEDANPFRVRAYRNAARTVAGLPHDISDMVHSEKDLTALPGIGKDLAGKIKEIVETGTLSQLKELGERISPELADLTKIPGLGPKRVKALHSALGIETPQELKQAAEKGRVKQVEGFGEKTEHSIREALRQDEAEEKRIKLLEAEQYARALVSYLKQADGIKEVTVAGSFRRKKETVGDLDILAASRKDAGVMDRFVDYEDVQKVVSKGQTRSTVMLRSGLQVDLRVVPQASYGAALHYFTGSKAHNIAVRKMAVKKDLKINEYGVFRGEKRIAGKTEEEVYRTVGLPYMEPELREDRGELDAALNNTLPNLITIKQIRGDLHAHTRETDGTGHAGRDG